MAESPQTALSGSDENAIFKTVLGHFDAPAYMRRARKVEDAYNALLAGCQAERDKLLTMVRVRLGTLHALAGDWQGVASLIGDVSLLIDMFETLQPRLRVAVSPTKSAKRLRQALDALRESVERFNRRWSDYLAGIDLAALNALRDGYNRWYVLEKELAIRSATVARMGFQPLAPLQIDDLRRMMPLLAMPLGEAPSSGGG